MTGNIPSDSVPPSGNQPTGPANQPQGPAPATPSTPSKPYVPPAGGGGGGKTLTWLGMTFDPEQTKQLNNIMIQNIGNAIQKYNDKGIKAIKNYEKISEGQDPDL